MKEKINNKINEVIEHILSKKVENITYNEYRILDNKYASLKWEEEQKGRNKEIAEMIAKTFGNSCCCTAPGTPLPDPVPEDDKKGE